jgi:4'-phosphopantetheinyl transferase EntD
VSDALRALAPLEAQARALLGSRMQLAVVHASEADAADANDLRDGRDAPEVSLRARDRRRGRAALARVLAQLGRAERADAVCFPHPELSLSHSGDWAIAAGCDAAGGLGIDLEFARPMDPRAARFFLVGHELHYVDALPRDRQGAELLRLWTVKEAVFKASAGNAGRLLADFALDDPAARAGSARRHDGSTFTARYGSIDLGEGWLALALATTGTCG